MLVIPYFWKAHSHFVCVVIDMREKTIAVYDSLYTKRRSSVLYNVSGQRIQTNANDDATRIQRVFKMLDFEYRARHMLDSDLHDAGWVDAPVHYVRVDARILGYVV